jgi:hypothetical protein
MTALNIVPQLGVLVSDYFAVSWKRNLQNDVLHGRCLAAYFADKSTG